MCDNNYKVIIRDRINDNERKNYNLQIDRVYSTGPGMNNLSKDVLSKLFKVGNMSGFRINGKRDKINYIVIYTTGEDLYWKDELDNSLGILIYYGDNKTPGNDLHNTKQGGNQILRNIFNAASSDNIEIRKTIPPIFVFKKQESRDVKFLGLAVPGISGKPAKDWLTAVWGCNKNNDRFLNYKAFFTILDTSSNNDYDSNINLGWLNDIENNKAYDSIYAPKEWKKFINGNRIHALMSKKEKYAKTKEEQLPENKVEMQMLNTIHDYFISKDNGYSFEQFANDFTMYMDDNVVDITTTRPYKDGGFDGIGKYRIFSNSQNEVLVDFYLQAKCYSISNGVGVKDTSRLISRLKNRQFGIMFTTSYIAKQAYTELLDDSHPVIFITGKNIIDFIIKNLEIFDKETLEKWLCKHY